MEKQFDKLDVSALSTADAALMHIAETERLTAEETVRLIAKTVTKAQPALPKKAAVTAVPDIRPKKRRLRVIGFLAAAVITASALGLSAAGNNRWHKYEMERYFGKDGEARLAAMELPEQETVRTDTMSVSADAFLWDGHRAVCLVTFDSADPDHPIDWLGMMHGDRENIFYYSMQLLDEEGQPLATAENPMTDDDPLWHTGSGAAWARSKGSITVEYSFLMTGPMNTDRIVLRFTDDDGTALDVPVQVTPALPAVTMRSESGEELYLSAIGFTASALYMDVTGGTDDDALFYLTLTDSTGGTRRAQAEKLGGGTLPWGGGTYTDGKLYEITEGMVYDIGKPESFSAFMDVSDVVEAEWMGETYTAVQQ